MKFIKTPYIVVFLLLCCNALYSQNPAQVRKLKTELGKITGSKEFKTATIGVCIMDVETGKVLVETNSEKSLIPASTMKLITTGAGLALLGDTFRFKTELDYAGPKYFGKPTVVFRGHGDPTFGSTRWGSSRTVADTIISRLKFAWNHTIYFDNKSWGEQTPPPGFEFGDLGFYYGVPAFAFNYADNTQYLVESSTKMPNGDALSYNLTTDNPYENPVELNAKNYDSKQGFAAYQPEKLFVNDLLKYDTLNIFSKNNTVLEKLSQPISLAQPLYTFYSPSLFDITTKTNHSSINLYAEGILRALSTNKYGYSTLDSSISIAKKFWKTEVGDLTGLRMTDGSGLSRSNLCTPLLFCKMLTAYTKRDNFNSFYSTIPVVGKDGTVKNFAKGTAADGSARLKSGSMSRVKCYAGYITGKNGKLYAVSIMFNNFEPDATVTAASAKIVGKVAELKGGKPKKAFVVNRGNK